MDGKLCVSKSEEEENEFAICEEYLPVSTILFNTVHDTGFSFCKNT